MNVVFDLADPYVETLEALFFLYGVEKDDCCDTLIAALDD
jgi:hypothetical protein